jgi:hypothetical protein
MSDISFDNPKKTPVKSNQLMNIVGVILILGVLIFTYIKQGSKGNESADVGNVNEENMQSSSDGAKLTLPEGKTVIPPVKQENDYTNIGESVDLTHKYFYVKKVEDGSLVAALLELYGSNSYTNVVMSIPSGFKQSGRGSYTVDGDKLILNRNSGIAIDGSLTIRKDQGNKLFLIMSNGVQYVEDDPGYYVKNSIPTPKFGDNRSNSGDANASNDYSDQHGNTEVGSEVSESQKQMIIDRLGSLYQAENSEDIDKICSYFSYPLERYYEQRGVSEERLRAMFNKAFNEILLQHNINMYWDDCQVGKSQDGFVVRVRGIHNSVTRKKPEESKSRNISLHIELDDNMYITKIYEVK